MASYRLAGVITTTSGDEFLAVRQPPPPALAEEEYKQFVDSDLWDVPSAPLNPIENDQLKLDSTVEIECDDSIREKLDLSRFDVESALNQVLTQVGLVGKFSEKWKVLKYTEEAEFGPDPPINTLFIQASFNQKDESLQEFCNSISKQEALELLSGSKHNPSSDRIGPLVYIGFLSQPEDQFSTFPLNFQEYPPGVTVVPMKSRTIKPFCTTNLVIFLPKKEISFSDFEQNNSDLILGDALIMDPGCSSQVHAKLGEIISLLPKRLIVFVTHHHKDHTDGLSVVRKTNPDAILLAHEKTMSRIKKGTWSGAYIEVTGGEKISLWGEKLQVISAPGHTDGHLALHHIDTNSLIVGDHCVGKGSAFLDTRSGANMTDYFDTTYKFLDLSPHVLIPMHGKINIWPKNMLCGYLKHRREREAMILNSIINGAKTLFDIIKDVYSNVDIKLWIPASSNVRLHVDHLNDQNKLPKGFSVEKFKSSCGFDFISRWIFAYLKSKITFSPLLFGAITLGGVSSIAYVIKKKFE
ncbi:hypothetical protein LUZ60_009912 [Juncus effusus]|nr:hypothetical protein LUZ60_009912 [Juncus effusus]